MDESDRKFEEALRERGRRRRGIYDKSSRWAAFPPPPRRRHRGRYLVAAAALLLATATFLSIRHYYARSRQLISLGPGRPYTGAAMMHLSHSGSPGHLPVDVYEYRLDPDTHVLSRRIRISPNVTAKALAAAATAADGSPRDPVERLAYLGVHIGSGDWEDYAGVRFLAAPVIRSTSAKMSLTISDRRPPPRHHLFALEYGTGALLMAMYCPPEGSSLGKELDEEKEVAEAWARPWQHDTPGSWGWRNSSDISIGDSSSSSTSSNIRFAWQPSISVFQLAGFTGLVTAWLNVYGVTSHGAVMRRTLAINNNGTREWVDDWLEIGSGVFGEARVATNLYAEYGHDRIVAIKDGEYRHAHGWYYQGAWDGAWWPLGRPHECRDQLGQPEAEIIVVCGGKIWHKTRDAGGVWSHYWTHFGTGLDYNNNNNNNNVRLRTHGLTSDDMWWRTLIVEDEDGETMYYTRRHRPRPTYGSSASVYETAHEDADVAKSHVFTWSEWKSYRTREVQVTDRCSSSWWANLKQLLRPWWLW